MALSVDTTPAKHVTVLRNGDGKYEGRKFVVSRRRYRTFDALLSDITHQISAPFGAVRRLYTPKGSRQIRGIDDLEGGATYVAGGSERFKKINYNPQQSPGKNWGFTTNAKPGFLADDPPPLVLPKKNKKYAQRSAQFHKVRQPVQFTVFRNGLSSDKGTRFLLKAREMKSFETVLSIISFKIRLVEGAVRRLFTLEGSVLHGPEDIADGGQYVACGHRRFIPAPYGESNQPAKMHKLPSIKRRKDLNQPSPRTQSNPLPAIQKKATEKKARSEKDSPAPIEEDKGNDDVMVIVSRGSQADLVEDASSVPSVFENEADEVVANKEDDADAEQLEEETSRNDVVEEDIAKTEITTIPSKSKLPIRKKSNQGVSSEAELETELKPENGESPPPRPSSFDSTLQDMGMSEYTEVFEEPSETPNFDHETDAEAESEADDDPGYETPFYHEDAEADSGAEDAPEYESPRHHDDAEAEDAPGYESPLHHEDAESEDVPEYESPRHHEDAESEDAPGYESPRHHEDAEAEDAPGYESPLHHEDAESEDVPEYESPRHHEDAESEDAPGYESPRHHEDAEAEDAPGYESPLHHEDAEAEDAPGYESPLHHEDAEAEDAPGYESPRHHEDAEAEVAPGYESPLHQEDAEAEGAPGYSTPFHHEDCGEEDAPGYETPAFSDRHHEEYLEEEIKSVPSKSKLDRNPPKKKGNPELLANGKDDSIFNATTDAKSTNQDGQFLMNNVDEGVSNGHEEVDEIEEDGELIEDKPIDLQHAEEIPDDDLSASKAANQDRRRSVSSNK